jgi:catechol-2,3-dioxygenase
MAPVPKFAHIVLQTNQLAAMRTFYCTVLDAHVVYENIMLCFLTFDDEHHRIALVQPPIGELPERTPLTVGLAHSAFTFPSLPDLLAKYSSLAAKGLLPRVCVQHGITTSLYYRDPDGNSVELQIDNFSTPDEATAYMHKEYDQDPIGPSFAPDKLIEALGAGVPLSTLTTRAWAASTPQVNVLELLAT